jgi:hypothetical protein
MITLQDHINELRAELRGSLCPHERTAIAAELEAALKDQDGAAGAQRPPG